MSRRHQRNLITQDPTGDFVNLKCSETGELKTDTQKTTFGEVLTAQLTPVIQESFPYLINERIWEKSTENGGTILHDNLKAVLNSGIVPTGLAEITTKKRIKFRAGIGILCRFTCLWDESANSDYSSMIGMCDNDETNGFCFYKTERGMSIVHINDAVIIASIPQDEWDDPCDGSKLMPLMDWSLGNVFEIRFQCLGYGAITFGLENPNTGKFQTVHTIKYANSQEEPSLSNPALPFHARIDNDEEGVGETKMKISSVVCFVEGINPALAGLRNTKSISALATTTEEAVFTLFNKDTFSGFTNYSIVYPTYLSISNPDTKTCVVKVVENATLGGTPNYVDFDTKSSMVSIDVSGTTLTGGNVLTTFLVGAGDTRTLNLREAGIEINPNNKLTVSSYTGNSTATLLYSIGWVEDQ